ncbi:MAG: carboxypeptidase regulatory-like domain-containing protein [Ardenticatenaceae bacterium]|nr:carboxypeptidase regulatory-like domain-containing protein [Ardenticatenaceae bacterium]
MKKQIVFLLWLWLVLVACSGGQATDPALSQSGGTPTPTREGTWTTAIDGFIYDFSATTDSPLADAIVRYEIVLSYFPEIQDGFEQQTNTDSQGEFNLPMILHDTDNIRVVVEADGYVPYEENFVGIDLVPGKTLTIGLQPDHTLP